MKNLFIMSTNTPSQVFVEVVNNLPKDNTVKRTLCNCKGRMYPKKPQNLSELSITGDWTLYKNERFLLYNSGPDSDERTINFSLDDGLQYITDANNWFCDGNFSLSPEHFLQLYVIRVKKRDVFVTAVYCLLERKAKSTYKKMFSILYEKCAERNFFPDPKVLHIDFEQATIQAAREIIGFELEIRGCFYHLCQNTYRKIQNLGLQKLYTNNDSFSHFCGMLDGLAGLAFLPLHKIDEGMNFLKTVVPPEADELLEYFDCTYVTGTYKKVGSGECIKLRRIKAMYQPKIWNVHESTLNGEHRTNNMCESWNNRFKHVVGHNHLTIWKLIDKMRQEISVNIAKIELNEIGLTSKRKENTLEHRLQILCQRSADNEPVDLILLNISHCLRKRSRE